MRRWAYVYETSVAISQSYDPGRLDQVISSCNCGVGQFLYEPASVIVGNQRVAVVR